MSRRHYKSVSGGGVLPAGYAECEYIESTGTQYIDTGVRASYDLESDLTYMNIGTQTNVDCTLATDSPTNYWCPAAQFSTTSRYVLCGVTYNVPRTFNEIHHVMFNEEKTHNCYHNGTMIGNFNKPFEKVSTSNTLYMFADHTSYGVDWHTRGRIYSLIMKENGEFVRNFVPVLRLSDNKLGMYDLCGSICPLTGTPFYINAGSGEFLYKLK